MWRSVTVGSFLRTSSIKRQSETIEIERYDVRLVGTGEVYGVNWRSTGVGLARRTASNMAGVTEIEAENIFFGQDFN